MTQFDARGYWERRLEGNWNLQGVGFRRLGRRFNEWAYRVRRDVFLRLVRESVPDLATANVLDIGSGTGFYVERWQELGVSRITGFDLTDAAVAKLRQAFPGVTFHRGDISDGDDALPSAGFDVVSAMDVLFHIVDDARYEAAIKTIHGLLKPGGRFVWSDGFPHDAEMRDEHIVCRRLAEIERMVCGTGFTIERRVPMFVLMNNPVDVRSRALKAVWYGAAGLFSRTEALGGFAGWLLYPLESRLVRSRSESPTTEIMVCRKTA